mgnify:FL=1
MLVIIGKLTQINILAVILIMLANLFKSTPIIDESSKYWILDTFVWALENFELSTFKNDTQLVLPTNDFYPDNVCNVHDMAQSIFDQTIHYAGLQHWPIILVKPNDYVQKKLPLLQFLDAKRGDLVSFTLPVTAGQNIQVSYNPNQVNQPQVLVASFAQSFAMIMIIQSGKTPPGGTNFIPQAVDLVACFMGFGVMLSNTAYQFKGGCGSCFNPKANRNVALSEDDMIYCLALFCVLKDLKIKSIVVHLKSHLRSTFKRAYKEHKQSIAQGSQTTLVNILSG